jgi:hypothetical protein
VPGRSSGGRTVTDNGLSTDELRQALVQLFVAARQAVALRLEATGVPFMVQAERTVVERDIQGPGSWSTGTVHHARNVLGAGMAARRVAPWLTTAEIAQARECASQLSAASTTVPFWAPLGTSGWELVQGMDLGASELPELSDESDDWVLRYIVLPALRWHLEALPNVRSRDDHRATMFADEVLQVTQDDHLRYIVFAPLSGIDLPRGSDTITEGEISIRRLSDDEQGEWFVERQGPPAFSLLDAEPPQVLLELRTSGSRNSQNLPPGGGIHFLLAAFQLHGYEVASKAVIECSSPRWVQSFDSPVAITLPRRSRTISASELTVTSFRQVIETAKRLERYDIVQPKTSSDLALHRFVSGTARQNDIDALLDFMIALEALLVPGNNPGDISYRFTIHGAYYLAQNIPDRTPIREQLRGIYKMRNNLVHGNRYPEQPDISAARANAHDLLRRGLLRSAHEGFPTAEVFLQMLLNTDII